MVRTDPMLVVAALAHEGVEILAAAALLVAVLGALGLSRSVRDWWRQGLEHLLNRDYYELGPAVQRFSQELGALREQDAIVNLLLDGLVDTLNLAGVAFVGLPEGLDPQMLRLIEPEDLRARRDFASPVGRAAVLSGLVSVDLAASRLSWSTPLLLDPWPGCAALVLIGPARGGLGLGLLVVGRKRTGRSLRRDDRMLLITLAHQAGTALENAVLFAGLKTSLAQVEVSTKQLVAARAEQQLLLRELVNADERQRATLARDLHDDALQEVLYLIRHSRLGVELLTSLEQQDEPPRNALASLGSTGDADARKQAGLARLRAELAQLVERSVVVEQRLRALCLGLYPALLHSLGLSAAMEDLAREHAQATGLRVTVECPDDALDAIEQLDPETALHTYRIAQEGLRNASKHAHATEATVALKLVRIAGDMGHHGAMHPMIQLDIEDDGGGMPLPIDYAALLREGHLGLAGMRERALRIDGRLDIERAARGGMRIRLLVPVTLNGPRLLAAEMRSTQHVRGGTSR